MPSALPTLRRPAVALAVCGALLAPPAQALVTFDLVDLGSFNPLGAGVGTSIATGINNSGVVVGNYFDGGVGDPSFPWYLPTTVAGLTTWRNLATAGLRNNTPGQPLPAEVVGISNNGLLAGNGSLGDGRMHALSWQINGTGMASTPTVFDALRAGMACTGPCDPSQFPYLAVAVNNQHVLLSNTLDQSRALYAPGSLTTVWGPTQAYNQIPAPVALNDAGTRLGSPYTGLNNLGQRVGMGPGDIPFLAWLVPDGFGTGGTRVERADINPMLRAGAPTTLARVTAINDLGQMVGQGSNGQAVLLTPSGSVAYVPPSGPFGGSGRWDTDLDMLPTAALSVEVAPAGGGVVIASSFDNGPFAQLAGRTVKRLSFGGSLPANSVPWLHDLLMVSAPLDVTVTGQVLVGADTSLTLQGGSRVVAADGLHNQGVLQVSSGSLKGRLDNQANAAVVVSAGRFDVVGDLRNGFCGVSHGGCLGTHGEVLVDASGVLAVSGDVSSVGDVRVDAGSSVLARSFSQADGRLTVDGTLDTYGGDVVLTGGSLDGNGTINAGVLLADGSRDGRFQVGGGPGFAFFRPGHSPGSFTIHGRLVIAEHGELELQVERLADGSLAWDQVSASSMQFLAGGRVHIVVGAGVAGAQLQTVSFFDCGAGCNVAAGTSFVVDGAADAQVQFSAAGLVLSVPAAQPVPEPASAALLLAGLLWVSQRMRRWRAQAA